MAVIGCGACIGVRPSEALRLVEKVAPGRAAGDHRPLDKKILVERFGILGTAGMIGSALLGRRVEPLLRRFRCAELPQLLRPVHVWYA